MSKRVLVLGGTGTLGSSVVRSLVEGGYTVRVLARSAEKARARFGEGVEVVEGDSTNRDHLGRALTECDAVHVSLPTESELIAVEHLVGLAEAGDAKDLGRISYISGTSVREENRWFEVVDVKMRAEGLLRGSGIPHVVFCPTWVMEVLPNSAGRTGPWSSRGKTRPGFTSLPRPTSEEWWPPLTKTTVPWGSGCSSMGPGALPCRRRFGYFMKPAIPRSSSCV